MNFYIKLENKWIYGKFPKDVDGGYYCPSRFSPNEYAVPTIRIFIRIMVASFFIAIGFIGVSYLLVKLATWVFLMSWYVKNGLEKKMCAGYPYLDHKDAIGISMSFIFSLIILLVVI